MIVDNNEEITTGNDGTEMCSSGADVAVEMCSPESHDTCGNGCLIGQITEIMTEKELTINHIFAKIGISTICRR